MIFAVFYGLNWIATVPPTVRLTSEAFGRENTGVVYDDRGEPPTGCIDGGVWRRSDPNDARRLPGSVLDRRRAVCHRGAVVPHGREITPSARGAGRCRRPCLNNSQLANSQLPTATQLPSNPTTQLPNHHWQLRRLPCTQSAGQLAHVHEPLALQETRGRRRPIATGAVDQQRRLLRQVADIFDQALQRNVYAALDCLRGALSGRPSTESF